MDNKVKLWNRNFIMIIIINFLVFMNHVMILSTFPFYIDYLGGSETLAGIAVTLFSFVAVVMRPVIGWLLNNGLRRKILLAGLVGMALMPIGYAAEGAKPAKGWHDKRKTLDELVKYL